MAERPLTVEMSEGCWRLDRHAVPAIDPEDRDTELIEGGLHLSCAQTVEGIVMEGQARPARASPSEATRRARRTATAT